MTNLIWTDRAHSSVSADSQRKGEKAGQPTGPARPIVAVTRGDLPGTGIDRLRQHARVVTWDAAVRPTTEELTGLCRATTGLICQSTDIIGEALLSKCPALRVVSTLGAGYDHIDLTALSRHGISAGNTPGVLTETTADLTFALVLAAGRRLQEGIDTVRSGCWQPGDINFLLGRDIHGATIGIVGYGGIGRAVARRAQGFGMRVLHCTESAATDDLATYMPLPKLLAASDFVSLHVPLTARNAGLIGREELALMKPTAVLVNTARGGVVDQEALVEALRRRRLFAAGLDVTTVEPIPAGDALLSLPNCVVLPHIGSASLATRTAMVDRAVDNVIASLTGRPLPYPLRPPRRQAG